MRKIILSIAFAFVIFGNVSMANAMSIFIATRLGDGTGYTEKLGRDFLSDLSSVVTKHY